MIMMTMMVLLVLDCSRGSNIIDSSRKFVQWVGVALIIPV